MIKKRKKQILLLIALLSVVAAFFIITNRISESHKKEHIMEKPEDYESYIQQYGTGEVLQYSYFAESSGVTEDNLRYIILEVYGENTSLEKNTVRYYIKDKAIIGKIFQVLNETEYYASNMNFRNDASDKYAGTCRIRFISSAEHSLDWFGYRTPSKDTYIFAAGLFNTRNLLTGVEEQRIDKYFNCGFFADQKIMQVLTDIVKNDIRKITMDEIKEILSSGEVPEIQDFYGYLHTLEKQSSQISEERYEEYRLDIEGGEYLLIRNENWGNEEKVVLDILMICLYDADGNMKEVLYEKAD